MAIEARIRELINEQGSITLDNMMREVLSINAASYYRNQHILGSLGDFITAPEVSQLFGEVIGLWCIDVWQKMGGASKISLIELGPGRGLLMRDLLKTAKLVPKFYTALEIGLVEINPHFIEWQKKNLSEFTVKINWLEQVFKILELPSIIIANEFFDSLPIKQYTKVKELWYEIILIIDPGDGRIKFDKVGVGKELQAQLLQDHPNAYDGAIIEESLEALNIVRFIADHIKKFQGAGLIIDYGYDIDLRKRQRTHYNSTLQAIKNYKYHPLFETLGEADLSSHVDFYAFKQAIKEEGVMAEKVMSQRDFLIQYGILIRKEQLIKKLNQTTSDIISKQVNRLISPSQMGNLFKVLEFRNLG